MTKDTIILMDNPEDGYCEARGWVSVDVPEDEARDLLAEFCTDDQGNDPARPVGEAKRVHLRLKNPAGHYEDQRWVQCGAKAKTAREFYEFDTTDTRAVASSSLRPSMEDS